MILRRIRFKEERGERRMERIKSLDCIQAFFVGGKCEIKAEVNDYIRCM
jgi:hypothetical protein